MSECQKPECRERLVRHRIFTSSQLHQSVISIPASESAWYRWLRTIPTFPSNCSLHTYLRIGRDAQQCGKLPLNQIPGKFIEAWIFYCFLCSIFSLQVPVARGYIYFSSVDYGKGGLCFAKGRIKNCLHLFVKKHDEV
jgi:hypothetical protein